jgi:hypothetical protein
MKKQHVRFIVYLVMTGACPILLLYPSFVYLDLAGMGGYDGFASPMMMEQQGMWSATGGHTMVFYALNGCFLLWILSLVNLPIACVVTVRNIQKSRQNT